MSYACSLSLSSQSVVTSGQDMYPQQYPQSLMDYKPYISGYPWMPAPMYPYGMQYMAGYQHMNHLTQVEVPPPAKRARFEPDEDLLHDLHLMSGYQQVDHLIQVEGRLPTAKRKHLQPDEDLPHCLPFMAGSQPVDPLPPAKRIRIKLDEDLPHLTDVWKYLLDISNEKGSLDDDGSVGSDDLNA